jgi:fatty acid amide hydrolase
MNPIVKLGLGELGRVLETREASSEEVTLAFLERIDETQPRLNSMAQILRERALRKARESDERRARGELRSRYDGVPMTLKENIDIAGHPSTLGLLKNKGRVADKNAVLTDLVEEAGMVVLGKTNVSQLMLFHESRNPVYGETKNPYDVTRGPGGSSGGEAAAVAAYQSPGGFGTDIGGSIRVPAHFCGVFGLKPTVGRISNLGIGSGVPGQEVIRGQSGPIARSARDLAALMEVARPEACAARDPRVPPLPLEQRAHARLRIGFFIDDGFLAPSPAIARALHEARDVLEHAGHTVIPFTPPLVEDLVFTYLAALSADGAETILSQVPKKELDEALTLLARLATLPTGPKKLAGKAIAELADRTAGKTMSAVGLKSVAELWKLTARARQIQAAAYDAWNQHELDAVLCAPHATVALPQGASRDFTLGGALSIRYNLLDFPAGVAPITRVRAGEEHHPGRPRERLAGRARSVEKGSAGMPVGVQVVARPWREDVVLHLLETLEDAVKGNDEYPRVAD